MGTPNCFAAGYITVVPLDGNYSIDPGNLPALDMAAPGRRL
jgi:hypothetical protein